MSVAGANLLEENGGELLPAYFPDKSPGQLEDLLDAYVADGVQKSAVITDTVLADQATEDWAYYRAYTAILARAAAVGPASAALTDQGSTTITGDQFRTLMDLRDRHLAAFNALVPATTGGAKEVAVSRAVPVITVW